MDEPVTLNFLSAANEDTGLTVKTLLSDGKDKLETLFRLLCMLGNRSAIVFCNHRESVERTSKFLKEKDIINEFYHGAMEKRNYQCISYNRPCIKGP